jgi:hypothetical protein
MTCSEKERLIAQTLTRSEAELLSRIEAAGTEGLLWDQGSSGTFARLARKGLIEYRMGATETSEDGFRTGMRFVAIRPRAPTSC